MATAAEIRKDVAELQDLLSRATRPKVKDLLELQMFKLEAEVITAAGKQLEEEDEAKKKASSRALSSDGDNLYTVQVTTYGFDQSEKFVKIYLTSLPKDSLKSIDPTAIQKTFGEKSARVTINNLDGKNYDLYISHLLHQIIPSSCSVKVKSDLVLVMLKKHDIGKHWDCLTQQEYTLKEKKKPKTQLDQDDKSADPSAGLMNLMKQMYDDGDDDMKRSIAKAWTESREKQDSGMGGGMSSGLSDMGI